LATGLHMIDFEQLKIENQTMTEKIEERNEELLKLRKKTTTTVQVLTHVKEKLQFVQQEVSVQKNTLSQIDEAVTHHRDLLTHLKAERDKLRGQNAKLKQQSGLMNEDLLEDFEQRAESTEALKERLDHVKQRHAAHTNVILAASSLQGSGF
jgi:chromosome segregation ATPase